MTPLLSSTAPAWALAAVPYDSPDARELTRCLHREQAETYGTADDPQATAPAEFERPRGLFLIARGPGGRPIACGGWRTAGPELAEVKRMYVAPGARGDGLGRHILAALEHDALTHGMKVSILETGVNNHAAIALYLACGYDPTQPYATGRDPRINRAYRKELARPEHEQPGEPRPDDRPAAETAAPPHGPA